MTINEAIGWDVANPRSKERMMTFGPMQLVAIDFPQNAMPSEVVKELQRLQVEGVVRLVDVVWISKDDHGNLNELPVPPPLREDAVLPGTLSAALFGDSANGDGGEAAWPELGVFATEAGEFGLGSDDLMEIADLIPRGSTTSMLLLEHLWAIGVKDAVTSTGGRVIAQGWLTPSTLIAMRAAMHEE